MYILVRFGNSDLITLKADHKMVDEIMKLNPDKVVFGFPAEMATRENIQKIEALRETR